VVTYSRRGGVAGEPDEFEDDATAEVPGRRSSASDGHRRRPEPARRRAAPASRPATGKGGSALLPTGCVLGGRYEIVSLVHAGGMAHVYKAIDRRCSSRERLVPVAVKVMRPYAAERVDAHDALRREADRARRLSHPNIINVYDFDEQGDHFFLVMEWLDGESVRDLLRRTAGQQLDGDLCWHIIEGTAAALRHAHEHGIVHADVNPANVFLTDDREVKLLDFGVARHVGDDARMLPAWATHRYASPDVLEGKPPVFEDDVFSLGCLAYRLLGGRPPFGRRSPLDAHSARQDAPRIESLPEADWALLRRALAFDRRERPSNVDGFLRQDDASARPPTRNSRSIGIGVAAAALTIAAVTTAAWILTRDAAPPAPAAESTAPVENEATEPGSAQREIATPELADGSAPAELARVDESGISAPAAAGPAAADSEQAVQAPPPEPGVSAAERLRIDAEQSLVSALQQVDARIDAGRLVEPEGDSARDLLIGLLPQHGNDPRVITRQERVAAMLIERSLAATDSGEFSAAYRHLDAAGTLGVLAVELRAARRDLDVAFDEAQALAAASRTQPDAEDPAAAVEPTAAEARASTGTTADPSSDAPGPAASNAEAMPDASAPVRRAEPSVPVAAASASTAAAGEAASTVNSQAPGAPADAGPSAADASAPASRADEATPTATPAAGEPVALAASRSGGNAAESAPAPAAPASVEGKAAKADQGPAKQDFVPLSDLGLERYVAPRFPRNAKYRDQTGYVVVRFAVLSNGRTADIEIVSAEPDDVFVGSAEEAVSRWRFARREEPAVAQVRLSFDLEE